MYSHENSSSFKTLTICYSYQLSLVQARKYNLEKVYRFYCTLPCSQISHNIGSAISKDLQLYSLLSREIPIQSYLFFLFQVYSSLSQNIPPTHTFHFDSTFKNSLWHKTFKQFKDIVCTIFSLFKIGLVPDPKTPKSQALCSL